VRFHILSVGRERADPTAPLVADYTNRIRKFLPIEETVLKTDQETRLSARILREKKNREIMAALDERGKDLSSDEFTKLVESWMNSGAPGIVFVVGGADGLPAEVRKRANILLSLSRMTLPHRFARLILAEQIYRALCEIRGVPYKR
jgi:23S rRNA (pseudouridine1915-N3)-methyltransferase